MNLHDFINSVLGLGHPRSPDFPGGREDFGEHDDFHEEAPAFFGFSGRGFSGIDNIFAHFHGDMQRQMQEMDRQMQDLFRNFGAVEFPGVEQPTQPENPRDYMLKEPDPESGTPGMRGTPGVRVPDTPGPRYEAPNPGPNFRSPFSFFGRWREQRPETMEDTDLDKEIQSPGDVAKLFENQPSNPHSGAMVPHPDQRGVTPRNFFSHRSMSVITRSMDGKTEQRKTVTDSSGNEVTTVTRSIGDQSYRVTTKTDKTGVKEKIENYQNMDENELHDFEQKWEGGRQGTPLPHQDMIKPPSSAHPTEGQSLLQRILGFDPFKKGP